MRRAPWLLSILLAGPLTAQEPAAPGDELTVSLITMGPGEAIWERFGHNAIRVADRRTGSDITYNFGMFDFRQEHFVLRFAQGRMHYWMEGHRAEREVAAYVRANRSVWEQALNLTGPQKLALRDFLEWNARDENKFYRYDYYRDNCSTRVRDAIDSVLAGAIRRHTAMSPAGTTYRFHTRRLTENDPLMYSAINTGLGPATDRPISQWEEMFLPLAMREHLRTVSVPAPGGGMQPLVRSERTLFTSTAPDPPSVPPRWWPVYLAAGVLLGTLLVLSAEQLEGNGLARWAFRIIGGGWSLLAGISGVVLAGLWLATDHDAAYANQNLLQLSPLSLPLAGLLPRLGSAHGTAGRWTTRLATGVALLAAAGMLWKVLPLTQQVNGEIIALALPLQLAVGLAVWRSGVRQRFQPIDPGRRDAV